MAAMTPAIPLSSAGVRQTVTGSALCLLLPAVPDVQKQPLVPRGCAPWGEWRMVRNPQHKTRLWGGDYGRQP